MSRQHRTMERHTKTRLRMRRRFGWRGEVRDIIWFDRYRHEIVIPDEIVEYTQFNGRDRPSPPKRKSRSSIPLPKCGLVRGKQETRVGILTRLLGEYFPEHRTRKLNKYDWKEVRRLNKLQKRARRGS